LINTNQQKLEEEKFIAEYLKDLSHYGEMMEEKEDEREDDEDEREDNEIDLEEVQESGFRE